MDRISAIATHLNNDIAYPFINCLDKLLSAIIGVHKSTSSLNNAPLNDLSNPAFDEFPPEIVGKILRYLALPELVPLAKTSPVFFSEVKCILKGCDKKDLSDYVLLLIKQSDETNMKTLSEMDNEFFHVFDECNGKTLLHTAIACKNDNICDMLLKAKSLNINAKDINLSTPLHCAISHNNIKLFNTLINMPTINLDDGHITFYDNTPLDPMMERWCVAVTPYEPILHFAVKSNSLEFVESLMKNKTANANTLDYYGDVALPNAFFRKPFNKKLVDSIVNHESFDVHYVNRQGRSLLFIALMYGRNEMIEILIRKGIDINQGGTTKDTPLHVAASHGNIEAVRKLITLPNIDVNIENHNGLTPYQDALRHYQDADCSSEKRTRYQHIMKLLQDFS